MKIGSLPHAELASSINFRIAYSSPLAPPKQPGRPTATEPRNSYAKRMSFGSYRRYGSTQFLRDLARQGVLQEKLLQPLFSSLVHR